MARYSENIIPKMTSDKAPSPIVITSSGISSVSTKEYMAFDRNNSTYYGSASGSPFLQIDFGVSRLIGKYKIAPPTSTDVVITRRPRKWKLQGSNDNGSFTTVDTRDYSALSSSSIPDTFEFLNNTAYRYYKILVESNEAFADGSYTQIGEVEMYELEYENKILIQLGSEYSSIHTSENLIPIMTSNITPSGVASASSVHSSAYDIWKVFNRTNTSAEDCWLPVNGVTKAYLNYEFDEFTVVNAYKIAIRNSSSNFLNASPRTWTFEGSYDGVLYEVLDEVKNEIWSMGEEKFYAFNNSKKFKHYRLNIIENSGHVNYVCVAKLEMFKKLAFNLTEVNSEQNFITHGMDPNTEIDMAAEMTNKIFIEQTPTTLGEGKVFSRKIDTSKTPIKKVSIE